LIYHICGWYIGLPTHLTSVVISSQLFICKTVSTLQRVAGG